MSAVAIRLLGGFGVSVDDVPVPPRAWRLRKARDLVKLLALAPDRRLHREQVMDALWPEHAPAAAANNLYQAVHAARRAIGPATIAVRDELVSLDAQAVVDVDEFRAAAREALRGSNARASRAAAALYGGELLPENLYDDWSIEARAELAELQRALLEAAAIVESAPPAGRLPVEASSFVGRARELAELRSLLRRTRLLTLAGTGGAGKTRLALELARAEGSEFSDGATLVDLSAVSDPVGVWASAALAFDVRALPGEELPDAVRSFLAPRRALIVVDNCEHVIGASAVLVETILQSAAGVTVLATSREPLRLPAEVIFRVPSLAIPDPERQSSPRELERYEAVKLFVERATSVYPQFRIDESNATDVARICFRLDGLPLALELAAGRLGALSPAAISARLDDRFRLLAAGRRTAPTRQQTLLATLDWSHDLLAEDERILFRRLAAFVGGCRLEAVEEVCTDHSLPERSIADVLARLVEKSLVTVGDVDGARRYGMLDTVSAYAQERLRTAGEEAELAARHTAWAMRIAEREGAAPTLDPEGPNLRRALSYLAARDPLATLGFCVAVWRFWLRRIDLVEAERRFTSALAAAPERTRLRADALRAAAAIDFRGGTLERGEARAQEARSIAEELGDPHGEWLSLQLLAICAIATDDSSAATRRAERGLALARREGFAAEQAVCIYTIGFAKWTRGELAEADRLLEESYSSFAAIESDELIESPLNITESRLRGADGGESLRVVFEDTLQPFVEVTCAAASAYVRANQAAVARQRGDPMRARLLLDESAAQLAALDDEPGAALVLTRRGFLELADGRPQEARAYLEQALEIRVRLNDRRGMGMALSALGTVAIDEGELEHAAERLNEARELFRRAGDRWGLVSTLWRIADLACAQSQLDEARLRLEEARRIVEETGRERWIAHTDASLAEVALLRGDEISARALLANARERYSAAWNTDGVAAVDRRLESLAKELQSSRKDGAEHTRPKRTTKGRKQ